MSVVLHLGRWQLWAGLERKWPFVWHAGRTKDPDFTLGLTVEFY